MDIMNYIARFRRQPAPPSKFVALDFDQHHLRIVSAEMQSDLPKFRKLVAVELPAELDRGSSQAMGEFIGQTLRELHLDGLPILMDVPRRQAVLKPLTLPAVEDERELPSMVRYQVESELPFAVDEAVIDFTIERHASAPMASAIKAAPAPGAKGDADANAAEATQPVLVAAVRRSVVEHYQAIADTAKVKLHAVGLRPYADTRCLVACLPMELRQQTLALVHIAGDEAEINVIVRGLLAFSRSAAVKQEAMPHGDTAGDAHAKEPHVEAPLDTPAATDTLVVEVMRTLQSAAAVQGGLTIDHLYVAGDTPLDQPLVDALAKRLNLPCEVLSPVESLKIKRAKTDGRGFITAIGLAVGHGDGGRMPFNFINPKRPPVERDIRKIRILTGSAAAALVLLVTIIVGIAQRVSASRELASLQETYNDLDKKNGPVQKLRQRVKAIDDWTNESRRWLDHWAQVTALFPGSKDAYVASMRSAGDDSIAINLRARTPDIITDLAKRLRAAGYDVQVGKQSFVTDPFGYGYDTLLTLDIDRKMKVDVANLRAEPRPTDDIGLQLIRRSESRSYNGSRGSSEDRGADPPASASSAPAASAPSANTTDTKPDTRPSSSSDARDSRGNSNDSRDSSRSRFDRRR